MKARRILYDLYVPSVSTLPYKYLCDRISDSR
jgi:hypothetical protein